MDTSLLVSFFALSALFASAVSQTCEQVHYERCLKQLLYFTEKGDLIFASTADGLQQECLQAQSALGCLTRYSKKCLPLEDRSKFNEGIAGPQRVTLGLCSDDSGFRSRYIQSLPCLRNISDGLMYCKEKYDRNQRDILLVEYEDKTHLQCCSFDGYRRCLQMLMLTQEGCREGTPSVVDEIATRLGGHLSDETCADHFNRCTGRATASIQTTLSLVWFILTVLSSSVLVKRL